MIQTNAGDFFFSALFVCVGAVVMGFLVMFASNEVLHCNFACTGRLWEAGKRGGL
jgi:hypothetical protein